jgi:hypothetical protein
MSSMNDVQLSKWWTTKSCQDACERAARARAEKLAKLRQQQQEKKERIAKEAAEWVQV